MTDTFTWKPINQPSDTTTLDTTATKYADGYEQSVPSGLNPASDSWPLTFVCNKAEMLTMRAFFIAHAGKRFLFTPPGSEQGLYQVDSFSRNQLASDLWTVTATFDQKFAP